MSHHSPEALKVHRSAMFYSQSLSQLLALMALLLTPCLARHDATSTVSLEPITFMSPTDQYNTRTLLERNIVFVPNSQNTTNINQTTTPSFTSTPTSTITTLSNSTSSSNSTVYRLDIPDNSGSNNLKYIYFVFLLLGIIIIGLIARVFILKRRRAKKQEKRVYNRNEALRLDLENRASDENQSDGSRGEDSPGREPTAPARTGYTFPLFSMTLFRAPPNRDANHPGEMEEVSNPPPPYPTHVKPAYFRESRLPVYEEVSEDEENDDRHSGRSDSHSERHLGPFSSRPQNAVNSTSASQNNHSSQDRLHGHAAIS